MVNQRNGDSNEHEEDDALEVSSCNEGRQQSQLMPYTHEGDVEDAMADEAPRNNCTSEILIQGQKTTKAKALRHRMATYASRSSADRLKRVQQLPCFDSVGGTSDTDIITSGDGTLGIPTLCIGNPIAIIV